jgi:endonuclease III
MAPSREAHERLLDRHGRTFAAELGIRLDREQPAPLFQLLVASLLMSARISTAIAVDASRALYDAGLTTARAVADATWQQRVDALGKGGYVRYDESTATYLGETAQLLLDRYDGDLRRLRREADGDPARIHELVQQCKGIGKVGADIFCREAQAVWEELRPYADEVALQAAAELGLGSTPRELAEVHGRHDLSLLTAALIRARLDGDLEELAHG